MSEEIHVLGNTSLTRVFSRIWARFAAYVTSPHFPMELCHILSVPWLSACCFLVNLWHLTLTTPTLVEVWYNMDYWLLRFLA